MKTAARVGVALAATAAIVSAACTALFVMFPALGISSTAVFQDVGFALPMTVGVGAGFLFAGGALAAWAFMAGCLFSTVRDLLADPGS